MADDTRQPDQEPAGPDASPAAVAPDGATPDSSASTDHMIPKSRFDEVNNQLKELRDQFAKQQAAEEASKKKDLEKREEFKALYETAQAEIEALKPIKDAHETLKTQTAERNQARIEKVPEAMRSLVPDYEDPFKLATWLDENDKVFSKPVPPSLNGGAGNNTRGGTVQQLSDAEIKEQAARLNVSPEHYKAALQQ